MSYLYRDLQNQASLLLVAQDKKQSDLTVREAMDVLKLQSISAAHYRLNQIASAGLITIRPVGIGKKNYYHVNAIIANDLVA